MAVNQPSGRKLVGIASILLLIMLVAVVAVCLSTPVARLPVVLQAIFYLVIGVIWIAPLKPLLRWMDAAPRGGDRAEP